MKILKQHFCCLLVCAAGLLAGLPQNARADVVIYDNGAPNHLGGDNLGTARQADDFVLTAPVTITEIRFWSLEAEDAYRGSISWSIQCDCGHMPGPVTMASGTQGMVNRTGLGSYLGLTEYRNDFYLNAPLALNPGAYWLVLHNGGFGDQGNPGEFLWETANANASAPGYRSFDASTWSSTANQHAFQITAVPEPMSVLMLVAGLALAACLRRREQASERFA